MGAFNQPELVVCDTRTLDTLSDDIFADGMAEVIKYGVIFDRDLFDKVSGGDVKSDIEKIIARCVELKRDVVAKDEFGHQIAVSAAKLVYAAGSDVATGDVMPFVILIAAAAFVVTILSKKRAF
mgnify:CR=1 FL=1